MKYISIDIETTGLDPDKDQILEVAMIEDDLSEQKPLDLLRKLHVLVLHPRYNVDDFILNLHTQNGLFADLARAKAIMKDKCVLYNADTIFCEINTLYSVLLPWLKEPKYNVAGKNVSGFDIPFLTRICPAFAKKFRRRTIDTAILYYQKGDDSLPDLSECKKRSGLADICVAHRAMGDAWDVVQLIRHAWRNL